jgi:adenylate kinase family enzyme
MKLLVIGPQLSGKTTLARYLREHTDLNISEVDEEILAANDGTWPSDNEYKDKVLIPGIYQRMAQLDNTVFFANYFAPLSQAEAFRDAGFGVVLLELPYEEMLRRNKHRMEHEGYDDATQWLMGQLENHKEIREAGLVDQVINATLPTPQVAQLLIAEARK